MVQQIASEPITTQLEINGGWLDYTIQENCAVIVVWKWEPHFCLESQSRPKVVFIESAYGLVTGTNYTHQINLSDGLLSYLSDHILELQEM